MCLKNLLLTSKKNSRYAFGSAAYLELKKKQILGTCTIYADLICHMYNEKEIHIYVIASLSYIHIV